MFFPCIYRFLETPKPLLKTEQTQSFYTRKQLCQNPSFFSSFIWILNHSINGFGGLFYREMSATIISDPMVVSTPETQPAAAAATSAKLIAGQTEVEFAKCDCCGLTEECTPGYIERVRERYHGKWICGLCAEAVKDEIVRATERLISTEEAMARHMNFCKKFVSSGYSCRHLQNLPCKQPIKTIINPFLNMI